MGEGDYDGFEFYWCVNIANPYVVVNPTSQELEPDVSYAGLLCGGSTSYETIAEGTMVYCSEPWLTQPGAVDAGGGWPEIAAADLAPLLSAGVALLAVAFVGRVLIRLSRA